MRVEHYNIVASVIKKKKLVASETIVWPTNNGSDRREMTHTRNFLKANDGPHQKEGG